MSTSPTYEVGDFVIFDKYSEELRPDLKRSDKKLSPNGKYRINELTIVDGKTMYEVVKDGSGKFDLVYAEEISHNENTRVSPEEMQAALKKSPPKLRLIPVKATAPVEETSQNAEQRELRRLKDAKENEEWNAQLIEGSYTPKGKEHRPRIREANESFEFIANDYLKEHDIENPNTDLVALITELNKVVDKAHFRIGGIFTHISFNELFKNYQNAKGENYATLREFVEDKFPRFTVRRAYYYMRVYTYFTVWGISEEDICEIGYVAANKILQVANKESAREWVEYAKSHSNSDLNAEVDKVYAGKQAEKNGDKVKTAKINLIGTPTLTESNYVDNEQSPSQWTDLIVPLPKDRLESYNTIKDSIIKKHDIKDVNNEMRIIDVLMSVYLDNENDTEPVTPHTRIAATEMMFQDYECILRHKETGELITNHYEQGEIQLSINKNEEKFLHEKSEAQANMLQ